MGARQRTELSRRLLLDLLNTIGRAGLKTDAFVVSSSREMLDLAEREGAHSIRENRDIGVNGAVELALIKLAEYREFMVIPADLPLLLPSDLRRAIAFKRAKMDIVISPSASFNGTNLLIFSKRADIRLSYGQDSFWNHLGDAASKRLSVVVHATRGVLVDVDTEEDAREAVKTRLSRRSVSFLRECHNLT